MLDRLNRLNRVLERFPYEICAAVYMMGVVSIGMEVVEVETWTRKVMFAWGLVFLALTVSLARSIKILGRARRVEGPFATELSDAAMSVMLHPFIVLLVLLPIL